MIIIYICVLFIATASILSLVTNPFRQFTYYKDPLSVKIENLVIYITQKKQIFAANTLFFQYIAYFKCGFHIVTNALFGSKPTQSKSAGDIAREIIRLRYNWKKYPYLISGEHFSMLYTRSLGIFYYPSLDPYSTAHNKEWEMRQAMYLKTLAYVLAYHKNHPHLYTTLVPTGRNMVTGIQIYAYPSDSMYSILFALQVCRGVIHFNYLYPKIDKPPFILQTQMAANQLLQEHFITLKLLWQEYHSTVFDPRTQLVKKKHLSGTKDITKKISGFYDNVVYWRTLQLAQELSLLPKDETYLENLKQRIIHTFWDEEYGFFIEDLSQESVKKRLYSSDWLIAFTTRFLDVADPIERKFYLKSIDYIQKNNIDKPFGLRYQSEDRASRQFPIVRMVLPVYGGSAIWSFWGMEYIKILILLSIYEPSSREKYQNAAREQIKKYQDNIEATRGFPEVYDSSGEFLSTLFYRSVRQTGWVIGYLQAVCMLNALSK